MFLTTIFMLFVEKEIHELPGFPGRLRVCMNRSGIHPFARGKRIRPILTLMTCNIFNDKIDKCHYSSYRIKSSITSHFFMTIWWIKQICVVTNLLSTKYGMRHSHSIRRCNGYCCLWTRMGQTDPAYLSPCLKSFTQTALEICGGQQYDMEFESRDDVTEAEYIEMIRLKTAVLIACSMKTGAIIAGLMNKMLDRHQLAFISDLPSSLWMTFWMFTATQSFGRRLEDILCNKRPFFWSTHSTLPTRNRRKSWQIG